MEPSSTPGPEPEAVEVRTEDPFLQLKARGLLLWGIASLPVGLAALALANGDVTREDIALSAWLYGLIMAWAWWSFRRLQIDPRHVIGRLPDHYRWLPCIGVTAGLILFSLAAVFFWFNLLSYPFPAFVESFLNETTANYGDPQVILAMVVLAPVAEEFLFRGILLHSWGARWGSKRALLFSSGLFALGHTPEVLGSFVFALVMGVLYCRTRTLIVPILCHALNNAFVVVWVLVETSVAGTDSSRYTIEHLRSDIWIGGICLALSLPWVVYFIRRNWPGDGWPAPYLINKDRFGSDKVEDPASTACPAGLPLCQLASAASSSPSDHAGTQVPHSGSWIPVE